MAILQDSSKRGARVDSKAQSAVEFLMIGVLGFVMVTAVSYIIYIQLGGQMANVNTAQLQKFGNTIVTTASRISYYGDTSVVTVQPTLPSGVISARIDGWDNETLILSYEKEGKLINMSFSSSVPLAIDLWSYRPGRKTIIIKAKGDYTLVCEKSLNRCNDYCDIGETAENSPNDCCTAQCYSCFEENVSISCKNDGTCHPACYGHNGCNVKC